MSEIQKIVKQCAQYRAKMSELRKGNTHGKGNKGRKLSPEQIDYLARINSNNYIGISPTGEVIRFSNAAKFCRDNPEWSFTKTKICECSKGSLPHYKGWKFFPGNYNLIEKDMIPEFFVKNYMAISPKGELIQFDAIKPFLKQYPALNHRGISYCLAGEKEFHKSWRFHHVYSCPLTPQPKSIWDRLPSFIL